MILVVSDERRFNGMYARGTAAHVNLQRAAHLMEAIIKLSALVARTTDYRLCT